MLLVDYIQRQMGLEGCVGVVSVRRVVPASCFPLHVIAVWITFKTHGVALWLCVVWQLQKKGHW